MANLKSAKKEIRKTKTRTKRNFKVKRAIKTLQKDIETLIKEGKEKEAEKMLTTAYKKIDKAAKTNVIHQNTAARYKSQLAKKVHSKDTKKKK